MTRIKHLSIRDFRNLARVEMDVPAPGFVLVGENGQGKTNLLEAIYYLQILRSVRGARDAELVRFGEQGFHISVDTDRQEISAGFLLRGKRKKITVDGGDMSRLSDAFGSLPSVTFSPRDLTIVSGAPSERRRFLDVMLALTSKKYLTALQQYKAALARRNAALREMSRATTPSSYAEDAIAIWEPTLAEHGTTLRNERRQWVAELCAEFTGLCTRLGERGEVTLNYSGSQNILSESLVARRPLDIKRGMTHSGPHRDDLELLLNGNPLKLYGSAGQQRTVAIALRILEAATIRTRTAQDPVFLMDDPFAELDIRRSHMILELLGTGQNHPDHPAQTILAVPRSTDIPPELSSLPRFSITDGVIS